MLQQITTNSAITTAVRPKRLRRHRTISGQTLAKTRSLEPRERADQAARWVVGSLTIAKPTVALAALVFGVCEALVREEIRELEADDSPTVEVPCGLNSSTTSFATGAPSDTTPMAA
jgi:hypothetical protein